MSQIVLEVEVKKIDGKDYVEWEEFRRVLTHVELVIVNNISFQKKVKK